MSTYATRQEFPLRVFVKNGPTHAAWKFGGGFRCACGRKLTCSPGIETDPRDGVEPTCRGCRERFALPDNTEGR